MHGTEHCVPERRAPRLLAPRKPVCPASASSPPGARSSIGRCILWRCPPVNPRLASPIDPPALPAELSLRLSPAAASSWPSLPGDLRLAPPTGPSACLRTQLPTFLAAASFGSALRSTFGLRLRCRLRACLPTQLPALTGCCVFRPVLPANLRLASPIGPSGLPAELNSKSHRRPALRRSLESPSDSRRRTTSGAAIIETNLRLSSDIASSSSALGSAFGLRLRPLPRACPPTQPPALAVCRVFLLSPPGQPF